ncbi:MAG TPA: UvrD-helicase domain-containing protein [Solirubrobacterales bacterium]|nr:UvrD-helicase domain-containing protein [Solirubrobacterales bacterium]
MSERTPTPEQSLAIEARGHDVLVEAGAGTGKTGVMVDRYCRLVCDLGVAPDAILAFTFTDKAATELRQRIRAELELRAVGESQRARELLATIGGAWVTTIHGFCNRLLAGHPVAAGVDPRFRVLDTPEAERAAREAFDDALAEFLAGGDEARERTVAAFEIAGLRAIVSGIHAELRSRGAAAPRLPDPPTPDPEAAVRRAAAVAAETLEELKPTNSNRELVERALAVLGDDVPDLDELTALRTDSKAKSMSAYREATDAAVARAAEAGEGGEAYRHIAELLALFSQRYEAVKERREGLDFEDLQLRAVRLLEREEIGNAYRARFSHLLVDEFQDTNRLQLRLIEALRGPRSELMVVGDELQSIYGFRHADLDVFRERRRAIEQSEDAAAIELSGNFRSRPEVIGAVNAIGEKLLGDAFHPLRVGGLPQLREPPGAGPAVELLLTARDGWDGEGIDLAPATDADTPPNHLAEARFLAARLSELVESGVERGEMVVLLRAFTHLDAYEDSLERAGLRPYTIGGRGYWSQQQVGDVCALLATIANPLDDQALFGALASPACGAAPDTLWLLRAAAGRRRHVWPALERVAGLEEAELEDPERLVEIPQSELTLLRDFARTVGELRARAGRLALADLIDTAIAETGYDLAVLMRPSGEARFANVRKLMRLAGEFEAREGRDLRGLLDFLFARAEADAEAEAASAIEGHDGVRIMTVHSAKGLEFGVVAVPSLSRRLLAGSRLPALTFGHEQADPRVGLQLRRLGAASLNLFAHEELCAETQQRDAAEELRLFHVAATRARERLILSGVAMPQPGRATQPGTPVIERILDGFEVDRERDSAIEIPAPRPREGLDVSLEPSQIAVRVSLPSPERAAELTAARREPAMPAPLGEGEAPLPARRTPAVPNRPLSYTAIAAYEECAYRFYMERVLGLGDRGRGLVPIPTQNSTASDEGEAGQRDEAAARGTAVHSLLEWSAANEWRRPSADLVRGHATAAGLTQGVEEELLAPIRAWLASDMLRERVQAPGVSSRAEVPLLLGVTDTTLRGSIDLLVERDGAPPLVIDYKTDRLNASSPAERAAKYATQRTIYALAVAEARDIKEVEVAYVFLDKPEEPAIELLDGEAMRRGREELAATIARIAAGEFPVAAVERRSWELCHGCPALGNLCSGPR